MNPQFLEVKEGVQLRSAGSSSSLKSGMYEVQSIEGDRVELLPFGSEEVVVASLRKLESSSACHFSTPKRKIEDSNIKELVLQYSESSAALLQMKTVSRRDKDNVRISVSTPALRNYQGSDKTVWSRMLPDERWALGTVMSDGSLVIEEVGQGLETLSKASRKLMGVTSPVEI